MSEAIKEVGGLLKQLFQPWNAFFKSLPLRRRIDGLHRVNYEHVCVLRCTQSALGLREYPLANLE